VIDPQLPVLGMGRGNQIGHYLQAVDEEPQSVSRIQVPTPLLPTGDVVKTLFLGRKILLCGGGELAPKSRLSR